METEKRYKARDIVKEIIFFVLFTIVAFAWFFVIQLIISFVTISVIHFTIKKIFIVSIVGTVLADTYYIIKRINKN